MRKIFWGVFFLVFISPACSKKEPAGAAAQAGGPDSSGTPAPVQSEADLITETPGDSTQVFAGVLTEDGDLIPIALLDRNGYQNPWTLPSYNGKAPPLPGQRFPRRWYLYTPDDAEDGTPLRLRALHLRTAQCGENWAFTTDRSLPFASTGGTEGAVLGVVFTVPMSRVSFLEHSPEAERLESARVSLGLVSNAKEEESAYEFVRLGYFRLGDVDIGLGQSIWYESTEYVVFEIRGSEGQVVLTSDGGGC